jgi:hypothetical protein
MGVPPQELLRNSEYAMKFFDRDGTVISIVSLHFKRCRRLVDNNTQTIG